MQLQKKVLLPRVESGKKNEQWTSEECYFASRQIGCIVGNHVHHSLFAE
jgi:hypothetical protein